MKNAETQHPTPEQYQEAVKTFLSLVQLYECRRTMLYLQAFYKIYRHHHPTEFFIIEHMEEFEILLIFLDRLQKLEGYPEGAV